jgi:hypothetical protein
VFAFGWIVLPGFGAIDLSVTWDPEWEQVLEAGWGVYFTFVVGVPFVVVAARPGLVRPVVAQLVVAAGALVVASLFALEIGALILGVWILVEAAVLVWLVGGGAGAWQLRSGERSPALLALATVGAVPWLVYAFDMWELNRANLPDADVTNGVDHYSVQGSLAVALVALTALAAVRNDLRRLAPACCGVSAAYLGLVSYAWPEAAGGLSRTWSVAAMAWGSALVAVAAVAAARNRQARSSRAACSAQSSRVRVTRSP